VTNAAEATASAMVELSYAIPATAARNFLASMVFRSSKPIEQPAPGWKRAKSPYEGLAFTVT